MVWGFRFDGGEALALAGPALPDEHDASFVWLHFNAADHGTRRWIESAGRLPKAVRELLLSQDHHQRALVDGGHVACVLHDFTREFDACAPTRAGALRLVVGERLLCTVRDQPLRSADIVRQRIAAGARPADAAAALDLLAGAIIEVMGSALRELDAAAERAEDELLADGHAPDTRQLVAMRRRAVQLHRLLSGLRAVCLRLETDEALPAPLLPAVEKFAQRVAGLDHGVVALQSQLRLLREELDLQAAQRTNRSLYVLSILSALMLPATFVTGLFGMNTGGLPWADSPLGTLTAGALAAASAFAVYLLLRVLGFARL